VQIWWPKQLKNIVEFNMSEVNAVTPINIDGIPIGPGHEPYIVAEISGNHNGDINKAIRLIEIAKESGAHAVKLQTYTADTMTIKSDKPDFQISGGLWDGHSLYELYEWAHTPWEWHEALFKRANELNITIFSTPFDESSVDYLEDLAVPAYKVASFEATDLPLIEYIASKGKPIILSTGMATLAEIEEAVTCIKNAGCNEIVVLHCISGYPTPIEQMNIATVADLANKFGCVVGLSDHSLSNVAAISSVSFGASFIEKHITIDRSDKGPDSEFSLEPDELKALCFDVKQAWSCIGKPNYERKPAEESNVTFRRSIYVIKDVKAGEVLTEDNIKRIRPGFGLEPKHFGSALGKVVNQDIGAGTPLSWDLIES